ncbi:hypothetical protein PLANPX_2650 [Lacipirellula parvula]|uniref:Uncharacterized protein n=1 Tax=Lacipirellula parvula TaxID=2650471 RepID=A0A5K7X929_9BACT|nr:hypothetical protein PLANPX_2650 [Lacipirellula parvula]
MVRHATSLEEVGSPGPGALACRHEHSDSRRARPSGQPASLAIPASQRHDEATY